MPKKWTAPHSSTSPAGSFPSSDFPSNRPNPSPSQIISPGTIHSLRLPNAIGRLLLSRTNHANNYQQTPKKNAGSPLQTPFSQQSLPSNMYPNGPVFAQQPQQPPLHGFPQRILPPHDYRQVQHLHYAHNLQYYRK